MSVNAAYLPSDRLHTLINGNDLPHTSQGSALFADISGFTSVTERLREIYGPRRGAEELAGHLNRVYEALIAEVDQHGGSILGFAGDAITCWFSGDSAPINAIACGLALLAAMHNVEQIILPNNESLLLGLKVVITTGTTKRFVVGDPNIQFIDALAGATVARIATGEALAKRGELLADKITVERLETSITIREWRRVLEEQFAVVDRLEVPDELSITPSNATFTLPDDILKPWIMTVLTKHLQAGLGEFHIELRPVTALFVRFTGIAYEDDPNASEKLDRLIRLAQNIVNRYEGNVLQLTIGDKGSYLYAAFGAPYAHEDDPTRALSAASDIRDQVNELGYIEPIQIGISRGIMRTGAYGGKSRRTYGVLGDEVNLAARLMTNAQPGTILISESMIGAKLDDFALQNLDPIQVKGKTRPIRIFQVIGRRDRTFEERFYTTPLVGREDELQKIWQALEPIFSGQHAGVIFIYGEAGMGKSRLAFEVQQRTHKDNPVTWLTGQADPLSRSPFSAFIYLLRPYFGQRRERDNQSNLAAFDIVFNNLVSNAPEPIQADLALYRSYLAGILGLVIPGSQYETADEKLRIDNIIAAVKAWARAEAIHQPFILHIEDAQWLDNISIRMVQNLTYNMEDIPVALLLTSRYNDNGTPYTIPDIYSVPVQSFDLNRLTESSVRDVAELVLAGQIAPRLGQFLSERAEGNPFFTEQLTLDLKERAVLYEKDSIWNLEENIAAEVPSGINGVLIARLDRLTEQVKGVVQTASVLGREFEIQVLSRMLREDETPAIHEAERETIWSVLDQVRYIFRHALLRDAAYSMQAQSQLKMLHQVAAETIETIYPSDETQYDALLEHWREAGIAEKFIRYTIPVCERIVGITADYDRAERLLRHALSERETQFRPALLRLRGDVAQLRGDYPKASTQYEECLTITDENNPQCILALDGLGKVYSQQGDYPTAMKLTQKALELAHYHHDQAGMARALATLGDAAFQQGDYPTAQAHFNESLRLFQEQGTHTGVVGALNRLGKIATIKGDKNTAHTYLEESLALCQAVGDRQQLGSILNNLGNMALDQGDSEATLSYYQRSLKIRREIGDRNGVGGSLGNLAILMIRQGKIDQGLEYAEASLRERRAIGDRKGIANALSLLASVAYDQNDLAAAQGYLEEGLQMQRAINDRWGIGTNITNLGEISRMQGDYAKAQAYFEEGLALYRQLEQPKDISDALTAQAWLAQVQDNFTKARELYEEALGIRRAINDQRGISRSLHYLSSLDARTEHYQEAEQSLTEALEIMQAIGDKNLSPSLAALALIKRKLGQPSQAVNSLMHQALSDVQTQGSPKAKLAIMIEISQLLYEDKKYAESAELLGLIFSLSNSIDVQYSLSRLSDDLSESLEETALEGALKRGKTLDLDHIIERLMAEFSGL
jgi:class 3 adenylate cyclase/tetratricopeptide (TPR) repeat protein